MSRHRNSRLAAACLAVALALASGCAGTAEPPPHATHQAAEALSQSAARALRQGNAPGALAQYNRALALADSVEDFQFAGTTLLNLALVHAQLGQVADAHARLDRILAAPQLYAGPLPAQAATRKALLALDEPDLPAALRWADAAQAACAAPCEVAAALGNLRAHVALERGDVDGAARLAEQAAGLAGAAGQSAEQANAQRLAGRAHARAGRGDTAAALLASALEVDHQLGLSDRVALDLLAAADNEARRNRPEVSRAYYERALNVYTAAGNRAAADAVRARMAGLRGGS